VANSTQPGPLLGSTVAFLVKLAVLAGALAAGEVFIAKWRLFRVPELLAGSFLLALLSVSASFFLA
jgi:formate hydrogenlyase subunit 4